MKCSRCHHDCRSVAKFCEKCGTPFKPASGSGPPVRSYDESQRALTESLKQQTATGEILRAISSSAENAGFDGELIRFAGRSLDG